MKRTLLSLLIAAMISPGLQAQDERPLKKGQNSVNLYYGVSIMKGVYKNLAGSVSSEISFSGIGPVGIVFEHMVTDVVGLGAEVGYSTLIMKYDYEGLDNNWNTQLYTAEWKFTTIRAMFRANFHFAKTENFDAYALISAGYRGNSWSITTNEPGWEEDDFSVSGFFPFGFKPGIGLRYFFTPNIGIHTEFALGTPMFCGGLSFRF